MMMLSDLALVSTLVLAGLVDFVDGFFTFLVFCFFISRGVEPEPAVTIARCFWARVDNDLPGFYADILLLILLTFEFLGDSLGSFLFLGDGSFTLYDDDLGVGCLNALITFSFATEPRRPAFWQAGV